MDRQTFLRQVDELFELPPGTLKGPKRLSPLRIGILWQWWAMLLSWTNTSNI